MSEHTVLIPAREGGHLRLRAGQAVRVVDVEGGQVADMFALSTADPTEYLSAPHTRAANDALFPAVGKSFMTNRRRPIMTLESDDSPGIHDMLIAACDPERFAGLGVEGWHASCAENYLTAAAAAGLPQTFVPQSVNLFMSIPWDDEGQLRWEAAQTKPGDSVTLRAVMDCVVVVSACPQDIIVINHNEPSPIGLDLVDRA